jgi:hypothetical protein
MAFEDFAKKKAAGGAIRPLADVALGVLLVLFLIALLKPSTAETLDVPLKLFVGITALLLFARAASWRSEQ